MFRCVGEMDQEIFADQCVVSVFFVEKMELFTENAALRVI